MLHEPTRGIDVQSKLEIYQLIRDLTKKGISVIVFTSDMLELIGDLRSDLCDVRRGNIRLPEGGGSDGGEDHAIIGKRQEGGYIMTGSVKAHGKQALPSVVIMVLMVVAASFASSRFLQRPT